MQATSVDGLFAQKIFRIPDYQRGYAWQREQLKDFWEDLVNLPGNHSHYTGVLTLKEVPSSDILETDNEFWLIEDYAYKLYHIVDGQQRLTTFIIFIQALLEFYQSVEENEGKKADEIYITDTLHVAAVQGKYLFKVNPRPQLFRTYKFGYMADNPSYRYLRHEILGEPGSGMLQETFYTLNLSNAKQYFREQFAALHKESGSAGLQDTYKKLTRRFLLNEYIIQDEFDVFVAFETMNNRGRKLSDLELLKNRLIYLTTLYGDEELEPADRKSLRTSVNDAWKEVYHQLGRNKTRPLNDDDFLRAHWTMFFKYSRKTGKDYIRFLLDEHFTPHNVHKKVEREVALETPEVQRSEESEEVVEDADNDDEVAFEEPATVSLAHLKPAEIEEYVSSLCSSAVHWFNSFYPDKTDNLSAEERSWIAKLNRVGMVNFRPLVMAILKNEGDAERRIRIFKAIERFIFIVFRMTTTRSLYGSTVFYRAAREFDRQAMTLEQIEAKLNELSESRFDEDGNLKEFEFYNLLRKKFEGGDGYYGWFGLRYFLYEYELHLESQAIQRKVDWNDLLKTPKDKISIEHIYPQSETREWKTAFARVAPDGRRYYQASLGNLLLLSQAVNASLQNDPFQGKKVAKFDESGKKLRNGYSDGSHSEIEVSQQSDWGPDEIRGRGMKLLEFMEDRWDFKFKNTEVKQKLLFLEADGE